MSVGDRLARGDKAAQFSAGTSSVDDPIELHNVAPEIEIPEVNGKPLFTVTDRRSFSETRDLPAASPVPEKPARFPEFEYTTFKPILDRILVKRVSTDKNKEILDDGSERDKRTGLITAAKFRQHSNVGVVLAAGDFVVVGGVKIPMEEVIRPGDRVTYGEYNAESANVPADKVRVLADAVQLDYQDDELGLWIVRVQDVRGVESPIINESQHEVPNV